MPWCPVCKNEYREGYTHCNDCDVDLVDSLEEGPRALIAGAEYDMNRMAELLQAKDVECFVRPGQRKDEFELYVTEEHAERATAYLQSYVGKPQAISSYAMFLYSNRTGYSFMPEVDMVSIIRLCVKMNSSSGTIRMMTLTAAPAPARIMPPPTIWLRA